MVTKYEKQIRRENKIKTNKVCTFFAYILIAANLVLLFLIILFDIRAIDINEIAVYVMCIACFLALIVCGLLRPRSSEKAKRITMVLSVISMFIGFLALPFGFLEASEISKARERHRLGQEYAKIENVLSYFSNYSNYNEPVALHNEESEDCGCTFLDNDNKVLEKFHALDYTLVDNGDGFEPSSIYIEIGYYAHSPKITLTKNYDGLIVFHPEEYDGRRKAFDDGINYYCIDSEQGLEIKQMIDNIIDLEKEEYETALDEHLNQIRIEKFIDNLDEEDECLRGNYDRYGDYKQILIDDAQGKIKDVIKGMNISKFTKLDRNRTLNLGHPNVTLFSSKGFGDEINYWNDTKVFRVARSCNLPYFKDAYIFIDYSVSDEIGNALINVVKEVIGLY